MKAPVYNQKGEKIEDFTLNPALFENEINEGLIHEYLILQQSNLRQPIAHTKRRGEIRGGGRKPHRQKGTGRARLGSIRTNQQRGGGSTFGPRNTRNFTISMPKQQRRKALFSLLSSKAKNNQVIILDSYQADKIQTKLFDQVLKQLPIKRNTLIVISEKNDLIQKSTRNLSEAKTILANYLNPKDLLKYHSLLFFKDALNKTEEIFLKPKAVKV
ncbi:MAG: 50S ribosomal protein L4, large subunit ribosomal protein L4 [Candidatus Peregrinibacteria bacterium GW2011_GWE2_39_6]|nr:MAG: 50S ribosomal protein L4, large subunit ribosomal protein L4 [Candidatus Peregrinibacteria bacterium GW2011_GWF2_39_17]KKR26534.1 MAG: 50S ribosomal protein L4, large subunit ribosomal protein L4 [Candidatus Peregrinibacteria bacterium GW2011_GWE2_39_6]